MSGKTIHTEKHTVEVPVAGLDPGGATDLPGGYVAIPASDGSGWSVVDIMTGERVDLQNNTIGALKELT